MLAMQPGAKPQVNGGYNRIAVDDANDVGLVEEQTAIWQPFSGNLRNNIGHPLASTPA